MDVLHLAAAVLAIDASCDAQIDVAPASVFVSIFDGGGDDGTWRSADDASLERIARDPDIYSEIARVRASNGRVVSVEITANSLDFGAKTTYCYRPSGTLARAVETSSGTMNLDREVRYLDDRGRLIGSTSQVGLVTPRPGASPSPDVRPAKVDLFRIVRALPFARLLPSAFL